MSREVVWTKRVEDFFAEAANLNDTERQVLRCRVSGMTRVQTSFYLSLSVSTIDKIVKRLKKLYDIVQQEYPDELKPRKPSVYENYMDEN